jgi:Tfp pilus assembly protein PilF
MQIRHRFADVYAWVGEAMLDAGQRSGARKHLRKSLLIRPWHARTARLFALSMLSEETGTSARAAFRHAKRILAPARRKAAPSCS